MKIIDSFIFYNELDLLEYRLSILDQYVDYFILVESTHTFTGHPKPLHYYEHRNRFAKFSNKIIHVVVEDFPYKVPNIRYEYNQQWQNEYYQRNCIQRGLDVLVSSLDADDILLTADVDEIPNPNILLRAKQGTLEFDRSNLNRMALDMYYYNLYYRVGDGSNWHGIKLMTIQAYHQIGLSFQQMRLWEHSHPVPVIERGGWHLSYFGDMQFIINKIASFSHQEYNNSDYLDKPELERKMKEGINLLNNSNLQFIPIEENKNLPYMYDTYLTPFFA